MRSLKIKVEEVLKEYPKLKARIKIKLLDLCSSYGLSSVDYQRLAGGERYMKSSKVEQYITSKLEDEAELQRLIIKQDKIDAILDSLPSKQAKVIRLMYFEEFKAPQIHPQIEGIECDNSVFNYRDRAITRMVELGMHKLG